jgi:hypothetical protein
MEMRREMPGETSGRRSGELSAATALLVSADEDLAADVRRLAAAAGASTMVADDPATALQILKEGLTKYYLEPEEALPKTDEAPEIARSRLS